MISSNLIIILKLLFFCFLLLLQINFAMIPITFEKLFPVLAPLPLECEFVWVWNPGSPHLMVLGWDVWLRQAALGIMVGGWWGWVLRRHLSQGKMGPGGGWLDWCWEMWIYFLVPIKILPGWHVITPLTPWSHHQPLFPSPDHPTPCARLLFSVLGHVAIIPIEVSQCCPLPLSYIESAEFI